MKLDLDYINKILVAVEDYPEGEMQQSALMEAINADANDKNDADKFYYHMKFIGQAGLMTSSHYGQISMRGGFGFDFDFHSGEMQLLSHTTYRLTLKGVEHLRSNTLFNKVKKEGLLTLRGVVVAVIGGVISGLIVLIVGFVWFNITP